MHKRRPPSERPETCTLLRRHCRFTYVCMLRIYIMYACLKLDVCGPSRGGYCIVFVCKPPVQKPPKDGGGQSAAADTGRSGTRLKEVP